MRLWELFGPLDKKNLQDIEKYLESAKPSTSLESKLVRSCDKPVTTMEKVDAAIQRGRTKFKA